MPGLGILLSLEKLALFCSEFKAILRSYDSRWTIQCLGSPGFELVSARIRMLLVARAGRRRWCRGPGCSWWRERYVDGQHVGLPSTADTHVHDPYAGIGENGPICEIPIDLVRRTFENNIFAPRFSSPFQAPAPYSFTHNQP